MIMEIKITEINRKETYVLAKLFIAAVSKLKIVIHNDDGIFQL